MLRVEETVMVKQVCREGGGKYQVISTNPAYPSFTLAGDNNQDWELVGRVAYRGERV